MSIFRESFWGAGFRNLGALRTGGPGSGFHVFDIESAGNQENYYWTSTMSSHENSPIVSVITPCHNAELFLTSFFNCIYSQTLTKWELIIIDDCSSDSTPDIIKSYAVNDDRVKYYRMDTNVGPAKVRNFGINQAKAQYIAFLDVDDLWHPSKLEIQVSWMKANSIGMSYHDYRHISFDLKTVGGVVRAPDQLTWLLLHKCRGLGCLSIMFDRKISSLPVFREDLDGILAEDLVAWLSVLKDGMIAKRLPHCLAYYRLSNKSRSSNKIRAVSSVWYIYRNFSKLSFSRCLWYMASYILSSSLIHFKCRPRLSVTELPDINSLIN